MLVSIIIPIYNVENYIEECLESVYQQTYPHIEVILVNDCTPDNSMKIANSIINKYKDKFPTTIVNHEQNKGLSEARNSGIKIAKGEYIYFIDSDDAIMLDAIDSLARVASRHNSLELIQGAFCTGERFAPTLYLKNRDEFIFKGDLAKKELLNTPYIWNTLLKRSFIIEHNITFNIKMTYAEDQFWGYSIAKGLSFMAKVLSATYYYRQRENSLCRNITPKHFENLLELLLFISNNLFQNKIIREVQINRFCCASLNYWSKSWVQCNCHYNFHKNLKNCIKKFISNNYKDMKASDYLLTLPYLFPYRTAIYIAKIIWKIRSKLSF